ncbi:MAG: hypothetical protein KA956_13500 [Pyrinomonadaceae bacterium]|nr:hypothetical protein [Acidobacteriota bacterium]MBP7377484.1 hypothetical protein [Pyrinomonadaceae bacterium]
MADWRELILDGRFAEAEPLMLADTEKRDGYGGETIVRAEFYEDWGNFFRSGPEDEKRYWRSHGYWALYASWSTSGGEGTARMIDVNRVLKKIESLKG